MYCKNNTTRMLRHASFFIFLSKNKKTFRYKSQGSINYALQYLVLLKIKIINHRKG